MDRGIDTIRNLSSYADKFHSLGLSFIGRYYGHGSSMPEKIMTPEESKAWKDEGIYKVIFFEDNPTKITYFSATKGTEDAGKAISMAGECGQPFNTPIYFTVDYGADQGEIETIADYFQAIRQGIKPWMPQAYRIGVYGSGMVCQALLARGLVEFTCLAESRGFAGTWEFYNSKQWNLNQVVADSSQGVPSSWNYDLLESQGSAGGWL